MLGEDLKESACHAMHEWETLILHLLTSANNTVTGFNVLVYCVACVCITRYGTILDGCFEFSTIYVISAHQNKF